MANFVGISLGRDELAIGVVARSKSGCTIEFIRRYEYPASDFDTAARAAFAAAKLEETPFSKLPVALSLPGESVSLQPLVVPFSRRSHIARTLPFEMEDSLPFDVAQGVLDFTMVAQEGKGSRILVAAIRRRELEAATEPLVAAGLKLSLVTTDVLSASALGSLTGEDYETLLLVDPSGWKLAVCKGGRIVFARAAPAAPAAQEFETALAGWVRQSFVAAPPGISADRILVCGAAAAGLNCEALSEMLSLPVERLSLPESAFGNAAGAEAPGDMLLAPAGVLAAQMLCLGGAHIDLLLAARGHGRTLKALFAPASVGLVLLVLLFGILAWGYAKQRKLGRYEEAKALASEREIWDNLFPGKKPAGGNVRLTLQSELARIKKTGGRQALGADVNWLPRAIYVLSRSIPAGRSMDFKKFVAASGKLTVSVSSSETAAAHQLAESITNEGTFSARYRELKTGEEGQTTFELVMQPKGQGDAG